MYQTLDKGAAGLLDRARTAETNAIAALRAVVMPLLRASLGILFIWFGALKTADVSPVTDIVTGTLPWIDPHQLMPALGAAEMLLGAALVTGKALRLALPVLTLHLCGTFLTFLMLPDIMVTNHNPLLLTAPGEFVMKNLVLIAAALALITHTPARTGPGPGRDPVPTAWKTPPTATGPASTPCTQHPKHFPPSHRCGPRRGPKTTSPGVRTVRRQAT